MYNYKLLWSPALANLHCVQKKHVTTFLMIS